MQKVQNKYKIVSNKKITSRVYRLSLDAKDVIKKVKPGQFIHIRVSEGLKPFFRRPFSIFKAGKYLEIFYDVVGQGTKILSERKTGEYLDVIGPVGNAFSMPPDDTKHIIMIAGGIGIAPFMILSDKLKQKNYDMTLLYGARNKEYLFSLKEFKANGCKTHISTDDGSHGVKGRVSELFSKIISKASDTIIYTCGPRPMMLSVQKFAKSKGIRAEASCEEIMACGLGACLGCSIKTKLGYKTVCHDGPVFNLENLIF